MAQPSIRDRALALDDAALASACAIDTFRASGPGGQKRNKTESAVRLRHLATGVAAEADESRSQHENRAKAVRRLRLAIAVEVREPVDVGTWEAPPALAMLVRVGSGPAVRREPRYAQAIAVVFDLLEAHGWSLADAAAHLGVTTAALSRFVAEEEFVFRAANTRRRARGLSPLRTR
ncbi:MAG: peptide chain release factor-like protein [Dehalococcoidia bacterium]|nr:MAG: peptide chain release factor-like protein [Dehalococcoidia bacterium]